MKDFANTTDIEAMDAFKNHLLFSLVICYPCNVTEFDEKKQLATVSIPLGFKSGDGGMMTPIVKGIPVVFPSCKDFSLTFPIQVGDSGLYLVASKDMQNWMASGKDGQRATQRAHNINDGIFVPGLRPQNTLIENFENDRISVRSKDGKSHLSILNNGEINITSTKITIDGDVVITKTLHSNQDITTDGNISTQNGDVKASTISLKNHTHAQGSYTAPSGGGPVTGTSGAPTP